MELTFQQSKEHGQHLSEELHLHGALRWAVRVTGHAMGVEVNANIDGYPVSCILVAGHTVPWAAVAEGLMADMEKLKSAAAPIGTPLLKPKERLIINPDGYAATPES